MFTTPRRALSTGLIGLTAVLGLAACFPDPGVPTPPTTTTTTSTTTSTTTTTTIPAPVFDVRVNEVESSGGTPGDWIELYNLGPDAADISGYTLKDNDDTHAYVLPSGSTVAAGGFLVVDEAALGFGLGAADSARLFATDGTTVVDSYSWTAHASTTYGRCPDGSGAFATTTVVTKGAANDCTPAPITTIHINEVESNGGTPGDWVELINTGAATVDISGWSLLDNDDTHAHSVLPSGSTVAPGAYLIVEETALGFGLGSADSVRLFDATGTLYETTSWTAHATTTLGRCPNGTGAFATTTSSTKAAANDCGNPVKINEVESNGGTPGDWIELINPGAAPVDVSGYILRDNDDTHTFTIPLATTIAAGGFYVAEEAALGFGLGSADSARFFTPGGALVDTYTWTAHASTTYGRCPNGTGAFATTTASTKGAINACTGDIVTAAWPGDSTVQTADLANVFGGNMSGLIYEGSGSAATGTLWAVKNGPGTLYRVVSDGTTWGPDSGDWAAGKTLHYGNGTGNPDAEGVTFTDGGSAAGIFVSTERNNDVSGTSKNAILRFDPNTPGTTLNATNEWDLTADLPVVGPNLGMEAITWVPDSTLVSKGFVDQSTNQLYNPANYANHGNGLFFVGLEANGAVYAYALDLTGNGFHRVATIATGFVGVMEVQFDRDRGNLWAVCDDGCQGRSTILAVNASGAFVPGTLYERPSTMPNLNNEGFAMAAATECVAGRKPVFWSDDSATDGHAIRTGTLSCTTP